MKSFVFSFDVFVAVMVLLFILEFLTFFHSLPSLLYLRYLQANYLAKDVYNYFENAGTSDEICTKIKEIWEDEIPQYGFKAIVGNSDEPFCEANSEIEKKARIKVVREGLIFYKGEDVYSSREEQTPYITCSGETCPLCYIPRVNIETVSTTTEPLRVEVFG